MFYSNIGDFASVAKLWFSRMVAFMITPLQCRMARAALQWSVNDLAAAAKLAPNTISSFEVEKRRPNRATLTVIRAAFEAAGVEFTNGEAPGVRVRK